MLVWCLDPTSGSCKIPGTCLDRLPVSARAAHQGPLRVSGGSECDLAPRGDAAPELGSHLRKPSSPHSHWEVWPKLLVTTGRRHSTKGNITGCSHCHHHHCHHRWWWWLPLFQTFHSNGHYAKALSLVISVLVPPDSQAMNWIVVYHFWPLFSPKRQRLRLIGWLGSINPLSRIRTFNPKHFKLLFYYPH